MGALAQQGSDVDADALARRISQLELYSQNPASVSANGTIAAIGDSIVANCYSQSPSAYNPAGTTSSNFNARSWIGWLNALSGNSFTPVYIGGVAGERTDQILTRLPIALSYAPRWLIDEGGTNDVSQITDPVACENAIVNNRLTVWSAAQKTLTRVIALSVPPVTSATAFNATQQAVIARVNRKLKALAAIFPNVTYVDTHGTLVDPTSASGYALTANNFDAIHPSPRGAFLMGQRIWNAISSQVTPYTGLIASQTDCVQIDALSRQLVNGADALFLGGTGGTAGTNVTGTVATNWTCGIATGSTGTAVASIVAAPDGVGNAQRLVISGAANNDEFRWLHFTTNTLAQIPAGTRFYMEVAVQVTSPVNLRCIYVSPFVQFTGGAASSPQASYGLLPTTGDSPIPNSGFGGSSAPFVIRSPVVQMPSDATALSQVRAQVFAAFGAASGSATVDVYRVSLVKE